MRRAVRTDPDRVAALGEVNPQELLDAAMVVGSKAMMQRLGFIANLVGRPLPHPRRQALRAAIPGSYRSHFGRAERREDDIGYVAAWGLYVHARRVDLLVEVPRLRPRAEVLCSPPTISE